MAHYQLCLLLLLVQWVVCCILPSELETSSLVCDCHLDWVIDWVKTTRIKVDGIANCALPTALRGQAVKSLKAEDLHCSQWHIFQ